MTAALAWQALTEYAEGDEPMHLIEAFHAFPAAEQDAAIEDHANRSVSTIARAAYIFAGNGDPSPTDLAEMERAPGYRAVLRGLLGEVLHVVA